MAQLPCISLYKAAMYFDRGYLLDIPCDAPVTVANFMGFPY